MIDAPPYHQAPWRTNAAAALTGGIWHCLANPTRSNGFNLFHYALDGRVNGSGPGNQLPKSQAKLPAQTVWLFDNGGRAAVARQNNVAPNRHDGMANFLLLDGSARSFPDHDFWDERLGQGRADNPNLRWDFAELP